MKRYLLAAAAAMIAIPSAHAQSGYESMVQSHAAANGVPASLVHRVIMRESRYNPRAVSKGNYGMMQIRLGTARGMGYTGSAAGLLDPETNMTYAVKYLAGAYKAAGGNENQAVRYYASGYYYAAKRQGLLPQQQATYQQPAFAQPTFQQPEFAQNTFEQPSWFESNAEMQPQGVRIIKKRRHHR